MAQYVTPAAIRENIMRQMHTSVHSGHLMFDKMIARIRERFFWPKQQKMVKEFISTCIPCHKSQEPRVKPKAKQMGILISKPLELITSDVLCPVKTSRSGNRYILVIIDHFTKFIQLYAMPNQLAVTLAKKLHKFMMKFGIQYEFLSDQGRNYQSFLLAQLWELLDVQRKRTTPYHPEADGLSERLNRTIKKMIKCYVNESHTDWDEHLDEMAFAPQKNG